MVEVSRYVVQSMDDFEHQVMEVDARENGDFRLTLVATCPDKGTASAISGLLNQHRPNGLAKP